MEKKNDETTMDETNSNYTPSQSYPSNIQWSIENESILVEWCDIAQCYRWLNTRAHHNYSFYHAWFTIPTITLSTITGTASFAQNSFTQSFREWSSMIIGSVNIMIGILTTVQQYLKISELNESHRVSAILWDKFSRNIKIELAKSPKERSDAGHFIKQCRKEFDHLMEVCPSIPPCVVTTFIQTFTNSLNFTICFKHLNEFFIMLHI
jgi:hypothetical protein